MVLINKIKLRSCFPFGAFPGMFTQNICALLPPYTHLGDVEEIFNPLGVSLGASES
jgi:hypothetical protein